MCYNRFMKKKIVIIGGGASGLICAITAAKKEHEIIVLEKNAKAGRKLLATGNGRCNISNLSISLQNYHGHHVGFVEYALKQFHYDVLKRFFESLGLDFTSVEDGRVFPMSLQASSVVDFLVDACLRKGVRLETGCEVQSVFPEGKKFKVLHEKGDILCDNVVIATGSLAAPALGSSDAGMRFAKEMGHRIFPAFPVLVQLRSDLPFCKRCSGVKISASLQAMVEKVPSASVRGDLLFTNYGISGLAVLDISRTVSAALYERKDVMIEVDLLPDISLPSLKKMLQNKSKRFCDKAPLLWLNGFLHKKIASALLRMLGLSDQQVLGTKALQKLAYTIKHLEIPIVDTNGAKGAEVMAGGVDCSEVDYKTMESKKVKGLFFTGEVLDIDADRGGYNLHWAWASGYLAGRKLSG